MSELRRSLAAAALLLACAGCDSPSESAKAGPPTLLAVVSGNQQESAVGEELPEPLVVRVLDSHGVPVANQLVNFRTLPGSGSVFGGASITNQEGLAQERWTLGVVAGDTQRVEARAVGNTTGQALVFASFTAVAKPAAPAVIAAVGPGEWSGPAGLPLSDSIAVKVTDAYGNPVPASAVVWRVQAGEGAVSPETSITDARGVARALWTLGSRLDSVQVVNAAAGIGVSALVRATASSPPTIVVTSFAGDAQQGTVGNELPEPLVVSLALSDGRPLAGATVSWVAANGAGTLNPAVATTDHMGRASAQWKLGNVAGAFLVTATVAGASPVTFGATAVPDAPATLTKSGGDRQTGEVGTTLPEMLSVRVADQYGNPHSDVLVRWAVLCEPVNGICGPNRAGSVQPESSRTDGNGIARTKWTLDTIPGEGKVAAKMEAIAPIVVFSATKQAPFRLLVTAPVTNSRHADTLAIVVWISRPSRRVTASVEGRTTDLRIVSSAWRGQILLGDMERGPKELLITATDTAGNTTATVASFIYDRKPLLQVASPTSNTVARPDAHLAASCQDDDPTDCQVTVSIAGWTGGSWPLSRTAFIPLAQAPARIDTRVSLADFDGQPVELLFEARDSAGQTTRLSRVGFVETSARWTEIETAGTRVKDIDGARVLYEDSSAAGISVQIRDRASRTASMVSAVEKLHQAYLTPRGAIFAVSDPYTYFNAKVYDWRDGSLLDLGNLNPHSGFWLAVAGSWASWYDGTSVFRRDLTAGSNVEFDQATSTERGIATNGDIVYSIRTATRSTILRYPYGVIQDDNSSTYANSRPITDGVNVVYVRETICCPSQYQIALHAGGTRLLLANPRLNDYGMHYEANNGWVAYMRAADGDTLQVWTRAPDGVERQVSFFAARSVIDALGPNGEVVFSSGTRRYVSTPPYTAVPVDIGRAWSDHSFVRSGSSSQLRVRSRIFWLKGDLIVTLGRSAFRIN